MSSKDPLQSDSRVQPLVEELAITRSPSSSEGEIEGEIEGQVEQVNSRLFPDNVHM